MQHFEGRWQVDFTGYIVSIGYICSGKETGWGPNTTQVLWRIKADKIGKIAATGPRAGPRVTIGSQHSLDNDYPCHAPHS